MKMDVAIENKTKENNSSHTSLLVGGLIKEHYASLQ